MLGIIVAVGAVAQQFFRVVVVVGAWPAAVEVCGGQRLDHPVAAFAGGPAVGQESVVGAAAQGELVDVGAPAARVVVVVVHLGELGGHGAARVAAAALFGVEH